VCSAIWQQVILLLLLSYLLVGTALIPGVVMLLFVLRLEPDNNEGRLESFATEPLNLKHHAAYIRLAIQVEKSLQTRSLRW